MKLGMHKLRPIPPTISKNEVIRMKKKKIEAKFASCSVKYTRNRGPTNILTRQKACHRMTVLSIFLNIWKMVLQLWCILFVSWCQKCLTLEWLIQWLVVWNYESWLLWVTLQSLAGILNKLHQNNVPLLQLSSCYSQFSRQLKDKQTKTLMYYWWFFSQM